VIALFGGFPLRLLKLRLGVEVPTLGASCSLVGSVERSDVFVLSTKSFFQLRSEPR
jgi:hypothetical protein